MRRTPMGYLSYRAASGRERRQGWEFVALLAAYTLAAGAAFHFVAANRGGEWRYLVAAVPGLLALVMALWGVRQLAALDEMMRRIWLEAAGFAVIGTASLSFSYGLLEMVGAPHLNWMAVWPMLGSFA